MIVEARDAEFGQILRRTRNPGSIYYTLPAKSSGRKLETRRRYYIGQLRERRHKLTGREQQVLSALEEGHVPLWRHRRYRDSDGKPRESTELVAAVPGYRFRVVQSKPGY